MPALDDDLPHDEDAPEDDINDGCKPSFDGPHDS